MPGDGTLSLARLVVNLADAMGAEARREFLRTGDLYEKGRADAFADLYNIAGALAEDP